MASAGVAGMASAGASGLAGSGGQAGSGACSPGDVRCIAQRERCGMDGAWHSEDFACAIDLSGSDEEAFACAIKSDGSFTCFTTASYQAPWYLAALANAPAQKWSRIFVEDDPASGDTSHSVCGVVATGGGTCWGELGGGSAADAIAYGNSSNSLCVLHSDHSLLCNPAASSAPLVGALVSQVVVRSGTAYALSTTGQVLPPFASNALPSGTYAQIEANNRELCGVRSDGALFCAPDAAPDALADKHVQQVAVEYSGDVCVILDDQSLWCSSKTFDFTPPAGRFTRVVTTETGMCAIRTDGSITCWGPNAIQPPAGW